MKTNIKKYIENQLKNSPEFKELLSKERNDHCNKAAKSENRRQLGQEVAEADLFGYLGRKGGDPNILAKISGNYFNKGFQERTGINLYDYDIGNKKKEEKADKDLYNSLFKRNFIVLGLVNLLIFCGMGVAIGVSYGVTGALIGAGIGVGVAAIFTTIYSYLTAKGEAAQSKYSIEERSRDKGIEVAKDLENDTKINLLESRLQKAENTLAQKEISRIESEYQAQNTAKNKK